MLSEVRARGGSLFAVQTAGTGRSYHQGVTLSDLAQVGWRRADGFVTIANAVPPGYVQRLVGYGNPVVQVGDEGPGAEGCASVVSDNALGVAQAVGHLAAHGHRRVAFVGCLDQFDIRERYEAYRAAVEHHDLEVSPGLVFSTDNNFEHGAGRAVESFLAAGCPSTASLVATDLNAVGFVRGLQAAGLQVPADQAVIGFDDKPDCALMSPALSTVAQDLDRVGRLAAELVLAAVGGAQLPPGRKVVPTSLVIRESCGCSLSGPRLAAFPPVAALDQFLAGMEGAAHVAHLRAGGHWPAMGAQLAAVFEEAARAGSTGAHLARVTELCQAFYADVPTRQAQDALDQFAGRLCAELGEMYSTAAARESLGHCLAQVGLSLARAQMDQRAGSYYQVRKELRDQYRLTLDLLGRHENDPRSLEWLRGTSARLGALGLWPVAAREHPMAPPEAAGRGSQLDLVATFDADGGALAVDGARVPVEQFPPDELLVGAGDKELVCVLPVASAGSDWGFLAVAEPLGPQLEQEAHFAWSALFSEALDHRALLSSLRQRGEDLSRSYQREKEMARAVRESEERYALAAEAANDGLWDWDLGTGTMYYSSRCKLLIGPGEQEVGRGPEEWLDRVHPEDAPALLAQFEELKAGRAAAFTNEHRLRATDGSYRWALARGLAVPGTGRPAQRVVGALTDVNERRELEERLRQQALYDPVTGLANRVLFLDRLAQAMAATRRRPRLSYAVLWLDLDNFKQLNDTMGHLCGDTVLAQVGQRIRGELRRTDTAARFGGDEFVVLLEEAGRPAADRLVRQLSEALSKPYELEGRAVVVTASIGAAVGGPGYERPEQVLRDADRAMYRAKSEHRQGHVCSVAEPVGALGA